MFLHVALPSCRLHSPHMLATAGLRLLGPSLLLARGGQMYFTDKLPSLILLFFFWGREVVLFQPSLVSQGTYTKRQWPQSMWLTNAPQVLASYPCLFLWFSVSLNSVLGVPRSEQYPLHDYSLLPRNTALLTRVNLRCHSCHSSGPLTPDAVSCSDSWVRIWGQLQRLKEFLCITSQGK